MKLTEFYRPHSLSGVIGQPAVNVLRRFSASPYASCWLLQGNPGVGKSAAALALAADLGAHDPFSGLLEVVAAKLVKDAAEDVLRRLWMRPFNGEWNVLVIEELERLSDEARCTLQHGLESAQLPSSAIVIATTNKPEKIGEALLERFTVLDFTSGETLADAAAFHLVKIWRQQSGGAELPSGFQKWGWIDGRFSVRRALDRLQTELLKLPEPAEVAA